MGSPVFRESLQGRHSHSSHGATQSQKSTPSEVTSRHKHPQLGGSLSMSWSEHTSTPLTHKPPIYQNDTNSSAYLCETIVDLTKRRINLQNKNENILTDIKQTQIIHDQ